MDTVTYPETYLYVYNNRSGESWIQEIKDNWLMDIKTRIKHFLKTEFCDEVKLDGDICRLDGEYTATIYTDGREPDGGVCWDSAGFYCKSTY